MLGKFWIVCLVRHPPSAIASFGFAHQVVGVSLNQKNIATTFADTQNMPHRQNTDPLAVDSLIFA